MTAGGGTGLGPLSGAAVLALLVGRFGADAVLDGFRRLDATRSAVALVVGVVTTVAAAWRWTVVARGIGLSVPLRHRGRGLLPLAAGQRHGSRRRRRRRRAGGAPRTSAPWPGVAARSVGWERFGGQAVQLASPPRSLLAVPSAFRAVAGWGAVGLLALSPSLGLAGRRCRGSATAG